MLEVKNLTKFYGPFEAVSDVSFTLRPGDVFGFIGSNGAGKTTTIRMLATLMEPTGGTASLNGHDIVKDPMAVRAMLGYMPDFFGMYEDTKVWEYLDFFAALYRVPSADRPAIIDNVLELTNLTTKREALVSSLSRGMQQRLMVAKCLVHEPDLLLLDEPASGLDPRARAELKDLIGELGAMGKIVVISSHILPELAEFCNSVGIIERGKLLACGPIDEIVKQVQATRQIEIRLLDRAAEVSMLLHGLPHVESTRMLGPHALQIEFDGTAEEQCELLEMLIAKGYRITEFREESADLEDVFLRVTTGAVN